MRLGAVAVGRDNNITVIRLAAATLVVYSHAYALARLGEEPLWTRTQFATCGLIGVWTFFVLSGFLIAGSLDRDRGMLAYWEARFLRLVPALALVLALSGLIVGPLTTTRPLGEYFASPLLWQYIGRNLLFETQYRLPGVFETNPYPGIVNGSLWSLRAEVYMYVLIAVVFVLKMGRERGVFNALLVLALLIQSKFPAGSELVPTEWDTPTKIAILCFGVGAFFYNNRASVPLSLAAVPALAILCFSGRFSARFALLFSLTLAYAVFVIAYHPRLQGRWSAARNDYSYGVFLFAFPVQQLLVHWLWPARPIGPIALFALTYPVTLACAALSWHLVEKRCLALKGRLVRAASAIPGGAGVPKQG